MVEQGQNKDDIIEQLKHDVQKANVERYEADFKQKYLQARMAAQELLHDEDKASLATLKKQHAKLQKKNKPLDKVTHLFQLPKLLFCMLCCMLCSAAICYAMQHIEASGQHRCLPCRVPSNTSGRTPA